MKCYKPSGETLTSYFRPAPNKQSHNKAANAVNSSCLFITPSTKRQTAVYKAIPSVASSVRSGPNPLLARRTRLRKWSPLSGSCFQDVKQPLSSFPKQRNTGPCGSAWPAVLPDPPSRKYPGNKGHIHISRSSARVGGFTFVQI